MTLLSSLPFSFLLLPLLCPREQKKKKSTLVVTEKGGVCSVVEWFVFFFFQNKDAYLLFHVTSTTMHNNSNTHTKSNNTSFKSAAYNFSTYVSVLVCVLSESFFFRFFLASLFRPFFRLFSLLCYQRIVFSFELFAFLFCFFFFEQY